MVVAAPDDVRWMRTALALARRNLGATWPNPAVGCVIVRDGVAVGRGWTQPGGRPHAERIAIDQAGARARGASVYVTLEPCAHRGQTPPCAQMLIDAGAARVFSALRDPDPRVSDRGHEMLRAAGLTLDIGLLAEEAARVNAGFLKRVTRGLPLVTLKLAASLDGKIATGRGESRWITGPAARRRVHLIRARHDAVLIGAGSARADDPMLDVRLPGMEGAAPVRIIADGSLSLPMTGRLARSAQTQPLWILCRAEAALARQRAFADLGARIIETPATARGELDLTAGLTTLAGLGLTRILCEGGGRLAASLILSELVDEMIWFSAGAALGADGLPAMAAFGLERLADAPRFRLSGMELVGDDVLSRWRPSRPITRPVLNAKT